MPLNGKVEVVPKIATLKELSGVIAGSSRFGRASTIQNASADGTVSTKVVIRVVALERNVPATEQNGVDPAAPCPTIGCPYHHGA